MDLSQLCKQAVEQACDTPGSALPMVLTAVAFGWAFIERNRAKFWKAQTVRPPAPAAAPSSSSSIAKPSLEPGPYASSNSPAISAHDESGRGDPPKSV